MTQPGEQASRPTHAGASGMMVRAANAAVAVALTLILLKAWAYSLSGSVSMLGSLMDSLMDSLASLINLVAIRFAVVPADDNHRFGHGKAEAIAGLVQAMVISLSALYLMVEAVGKLIHPEPISHAEENIAVLLAALALTVGLVLYQRHVIRQTGSVAISADSLHYSGDILMNMGVLLALVLSGYTSLYLADPIIGIMVALFLMYNVILIGRTSVDMLMDREMEDDDKEKIMAIIKAHPEVIGVHDMKTRRSGLDLFIQFHLVMDRHMPLSRVHHISEDVEKEIMAEFPAAEVLVHADPEGLDEEITFHE